MEKILHYFLLTSLQYSIMNQGLEVDTSTHAIILL